MRKNLAVTVTTTAALAAAVLAGSAPATASPSVAAAPAAAIGTAQSRYVPMTTTRFLDTRQSSALGPNASRSVQITGRGGIPTTGVTAVVVNVTAISPTAATYVSVWPAGGARPTVSALNVRKGETRANLVTVPVSASGQISYYNASGSTHLAMDVVGYYRTEATAGTSALKYLNVSPVRLYDSRQSGAQNVPAYTVLHIGLGALDPSIKSLAINVTAVRPAASAYLTVYDGSTSQPPNSSSLNFAAGQVTPNMTVVPVKRAADGTASIAVANWSRSTTVPILIDAYGVYSANAPYTFRPVAPTRLVDTRRTNTPLLTNQTRTVTASAGTTAAVPANTMAVVGNATAITPTSDSYLTLWEGGVTARPGTSSVNVARGQTAANSAWPRVNGTATAKTFAVFNQNASVHFAYDVMGVFVDPAKAGYGTSSTLGSVDLKKASSVHTSTIGG